MQAIATLMLAAALLAATASPHVATAGEDPRGEVFDLPLITRGVDRARQLLAADRAEDAGALVAEMRTILPDVPFLALFEVVVEVRKGKLYTARRALSAALDAGVPPSDRLLDLPAFSALAKDPESRAILERARARPHPRPRPDYLVPAQPIRVRDGIARVTGANTVWDPEAKVLRPRFVFPAGTTDDPVAEMTVKGRSEMPYDVRRRLNDLHARGLASGNAGDLYDNRDGGHSGMKAESLAQVTFTRYGPEAKARGMHSGANRYLLFDRPTFGNSSTVTRGRSQTRHLLTIPGGPTALQNQYTNNHIYVYPEHRDHDPETGDLYPANTPYVLTSQGSSGSDQRLFRGVGVALAALPPEVKDLARSQGLIAPTVQMVLRRSMAADDGDAAYLAPEAHPPVFEGGRVNYGRVIDHAQALAPDTLPPMVRLSVVEEDTPRPGVEVFQTGVGQTLFDTASAIARIHRTTAHRLNLTVSAAATRDPNGHPLRFEWRVLRGDADRIRIEPRDDRSGVVDLSIPWHGDRAVPGRPEMTTNRVDIAVFAHNGTHYSAPAFVSVAYPPNQARSYSEDGRVLRIAYPRIGQEPGPADPRLFLRHGWTDTYRYATSGALLGWSRTAGERASDYTADGLRVLGRDDAGRPLRAERVEYSVRRHKGEKLSVDIQSGGRKVTYRYETPMDRQGTPVEAD